MGCSNIKSKNQKKESKYLEGQPKAAVQSNKKTKLLRLLELEKNITNCINQQDRLKDQDLVFLIGKTGIGKSTTINYLAGKDIQRNGIVFKVNGKSISEIGYSSTSHTQTIISLHLEKQNIYLCDCPGFDDTNGFEADLINSQLIIKTIQSAKSASFILFMTPAELQVGRAGPMKKLIDQLLKLFDGVPEFKKSIKLAFTQISTEEEKKKIKEIKQYLGQMQDAFEDDNSTNFVNWMTDCIKNKKNIEYFIIQPEDKTKISRILKIIEEIPRIQSEQLKKLQPTNISSDAISHLKIFLSDCLKEIDISFEETNFLQGLHFFKCLLLINASLKYPAFTEYYNDSVSKLSKLQAGQDFNTTLKDFRSKNAFNSQKASEVKDLIEKTLWYSLIKEVVGAVEKDSQLKNVYSNQLNIINSFFTKLELSIEKSDLLKEKYEQYQKLSYLSQNLKFQVNIDDLEYFSQNYNFNTTQYEIPLSFNDILQKQLNNIGLFCQKNNDSLSNWLKNELQDQQVHEQLTNLEFCKTAEIYENLQLQISDRIEYDDIVDQLMVKMESCISDLKAVNLKIISGLENEDFTTFLESNNVSSYHFLTFTLVEKNTGTHFQSDTIQQQLARLKMTLESVISSCFEKGATIQEFENLIPYQQFISLFKIMDTAVWEQISDKSDLFLLYQKNIETLFLNWRQFLQDSFLKVKTSTVDSINKGLTHKVESEVISTFQQFIICLLSLENIIQQFPHNNLFINEFNSIFDEYKGFIQGLENNINLDNLDNIKSNLIRIQVLLINYTQNAKHSSISLTSLQLKQQQFTYFLKELHKMLNLVINNSEKQIDCLDLLKNTLSQYEKGLQNLQKYKLVLDQYKTAFESSIFQVVGCWQQKQKTINIKLKNSNGQPFNNYINVEETMFLPEQQMQQSVKLGLSKLNSKLETVYQSISNYVKTTHELDLASIGQLMRTKESRDIIVVLDLFKTIFSGDYPQIALYMKENYYNKLIIELNNILKEKQQYISNNSTNFAEFERLKKEFSDFKESMMNHLTENNLLTIAIEEAKIQAVKDKIDTQLLNYISNYNFEQAKKLMNGISLKEEEKIEELVQIKIKKLISDLKNETQELQKSLKETVQNNIITLINTFDQAQITFPVSYLIKQELIDIQQNYTEGLINLLFISLESPEKTTEIFLTSTVLKNYLIQLDSLKDADFRMKDKKEITDFLKVKIEEKFDQLYKSISENRKKIEQEELIQQINSVSQIVALTEFLKYPNIASMCSMLDRIRQMFTLTQEVLCEKATLYIHSKCRFSGPDTKNYLMKFSESVCQTFQKNDSELEIWISNYVKQAELKILSTIKKIESQDMNQILQELKSNPSSNLVKDTIYLTIVKMKLELKQNISKHNKNNVIKQVKLIQEMIIFFSSHDQTLCEKITNLKNDIISEILEKWRKLQSVDFDSQSINEFLSLVVYFENISQWCEQEESLSQCGIFHLISTIYNAFDAKLNSIRMSIEKFDHSELYIHYNSLLKIQNHTISYGKSNEELKENKQMNIYEIFETFIQAFSNQLTMEQCQMYSVINKEFTRSYIIQQIRYRVLEKINSITQKDLNTFDSNSLQALVSIQLQLIEFCKEIQKIDQSILHFQKQQRFIFDWVEQQYQRVFNEAVEIFNKKQNLPQKIIEAQKTIKNIEQHFAQHSEIIALNCLSKRFKKTLEGQYNLIYQSIKDNITKFSSPEGREQCVKSFIELYSYATQFLEKHELNTRMREIFRTVLQGQSIDVVKDLIRYFKQTEQGQKLHEEYDDLFKNWYIEIYNEKTKNQNNFAYLKDAMKVVQEYNDVQFNIAEMQVQFEYYQKIYLDLSGNISLDINQLTNQINLLVDKFLNNDSSFLGLNRPVVWTQEQKKSLLEILAHISAAWTLIDCFDKNEKSRRYVHTVQIVTIMRLLNIDTNQTSQMYNHIAQVRTGEGKSIALGITSTILALLKFKVNCCCYSKYLSERDYISFQKFFTHFKIEKRIQYGTFFELTEMIINKPHDLRHLADNAIKQTSFNQYNNNQQLKEKSVLIIDEVDFFFGPTFLGNVYSVGYQYTNQEVVNLFTYIWKKKYSYLTLQKIQLSYEYKSLFFRHSYLSKFQQIVDNKINQMIQDAKKMDKHSYLLRSKDLGERIIGYKEIDGITFGTNKGYKTAFAYCQEYERRKITIQQRNKRLCFNFNVGSFSYPLVTQNYNLILGVTGTLEYMSEFQINAMRRLCSISKQTITPSIYGQSKFQFKEQVDVHLRDNLNEQHQIITSQIQKVLNQNRSVLVFFSGKYSLVQYQKYLENNLQGATKKLQVLDEETINKQFRIDQAAQSGFITLSTKTFGRGTDFKCFDKDLSDNGGIHAIQTFFSETLAEEVQIKGRVARNGEPGSYSMVLLQSDILETFKIDRIQVPRDNSLYQYLSNLRNTRQNTIDQEDLKKQSQNVEIHKKSQMLNEHLQKTGVFDQKSLEIFKELSHFGDLKDIKVNNENNNSNPYNEINQNDIKKDAKKDRFNNLEGDEYNLVKKDSLKNKSLIIGQFSNPPDCNLTVECEHQLRVSLKKLGFKNFEVVIDEEQFISQINDYDQIWIISGSEFRNKSYDIESRFVTAVLQQLKQKKGLFLLSDNLPYYYHANKILQRQPIGFEDNSPVHMRLQGNDKANNVLKRGNYNHQLQFGNHLITNSLDNIFEGDTICFPKIDNGKMHDSYEDFYDIEIIGTSQTNKPCIFVLNGNNKRGRIVFDCGFTKLILQNWNGTHGTERYFQNCYAWLYFLDSEIIK